MGSTREKPVFRQDWKFMPKTNTLAYFEEEKSFLILLLGV
jgi:hypothetical protein